MASNSSDKVETPWGPLDALTVLNRNTGERFAATSAEPDLSDNNGDWIVCFAGQSWYFLDEDGAAHGTPFVIEGA